jgi:PAS domain S-box-containing protein
VNPFLKKVLPAVAFVLSGAAALASITAIFIVLVGGHLRWIDFGAPLATGSMLGWAAYYWRSRNRRVQSRLIRLNLVLKAIRELGHLMTRERNRELLIQGLCDILVQNRGYHSAWIALRNRAGEWASFAQSGLPRPVDQFFGSLRRGEQVACSRKALSRNDIVVIDNPAALCTGCPMVGSYENRGALCRRIAFNGKTYGVLTLSIARSLAMDAAEQKLVGEIVDDIAFGLYNIDIQEEREEAERDLRVSMDALGERIRELNCLFGLSRLIEKPGITLAEIFQGVAVLIPPAWQYPHNTVARVTFHDKSYDSEHFRETRQRLENDILVAERPVGKITVCYLEEIPAGGADPFLPEERSLLKALAERLGRTIERKRTEEALSGSERRFRTLIENSPTGISIVQDGEVVYQNQEQERLLGPLPRMYVLGDHDNIHPDDVDTVRRLGDAIFAGESRSLMVEFRYFLGGDPASSIWIHCRAHAIEYRQKDAVLVNMMDMTQIKELEKMLFIQDRMASLGRVAAGIAHEVRSPLSGINIYLDTLRNLVQEGEDAEKLVAVIRRALSASRKIDAVIRRVMDFSKPGRPNLVVADINHAVEEAVGLLSVTLRKAGVTLELSLADDLQKCRIDRQQIEEVVINLVHNAVDAMSRESGPKRIRISTAAAKGLVQIAVLDSGPGVPLEKKDKIFDPFYTSKPDNTGIGLSICHRIVSDHGGTIAVRSGPMGGAEFCIAVPASKIDENPLP